MHSILTYNSKAHIDIALLMQEFERDSNSFMMKLQHELQIHFISSILFVPLFVCRINIGIYD